MTNSSESSRPAIAIIGASALFPGSIDATGFWKDILAGSDLITDVPESHWLLEDYYDPDPSVPDKTYANRGAFLKSVDFDSMGWGVPPNLLQETDTSQLLALIVAQKVLEDACQQSGEALESLDRSKVSVILGVTSGQELLGSMVSRLQRPVWVKALRESGLPEPEVQTICDRISDNYTPWKESTFPGLLGNVVAGRIANRMDLGGTNCVTDAACASTFSALSMAVNELYLGDSDMVITGGVDTMNDIFMFMCFSKTPALSPTGDCRPFSDQADGTMLGEGLGMVALKRLEDAERDGDQVYAVINAVGSSSDGRAKSVYAPLPEGQAKALRRAYSNAGFGPEEVELVEAHGTGTKAGDAAEFAGLATAFSESGRPDPQWCALGSVKSQVGHAKAAAAAAGLFKAVMALHHKVLPPTIKVERPNPSLDIETSPFHLATEARPWIRDARFPRRAGVSSFGFGGSNFHVALTEYADRGEGSHAAPRLRSMTAELVTFSADNATDLVGRLRSAAKDHTKPGALTWLAHTSQRDFDASSDLRLTLVASDEEDLGNRLTQAAKTIEAAPDQPFSTPGGIHYGVGEKSGGLAYLFSGQGSQYLQMGAALAMEFGQARGVWDRAANCEWDGETRLHHVVFPPTAFETEDREAQEKKLAATEWAQPAIGCTSLSLLSLLDQLGLEADAFGGHSFGEVTALHAAGVLREEDFLAVARRRGELMAHAAVNPGSMIAVSEPIDRIQKLIDGWDTKVVIANHNAPEQVVLSGETTEIEAVEEKLTAEKISSVRLPVATAFHSPVVEKASGAFREFLEEVEFQAPKGPVYSNTTGAEHDASPDSLRNKLGEQLAHAVKFVDMIEAMYESGIRDFVEVGPGSVLTGLVTRILKGRPHVAINLDRKGRDGVRALVEALARLSAGGHALDFDALWSEFLAPENPNDRIEPKLKIPINGTNHGKPYPPQGGASALPAPNLTPVPKPIPASSPSSTSTSTTASPMENPNVTAEAPRPHPMAPPPMAKTPAGPVPAAPHVAPMPVSAPVPAPVFAPAPAAAPGWAAAYQDAQRLTAEAHVAYLQAMAHTHTAYLDTIERSFQSLSGQQAPRPALQPAPQFQPQPIAPPLAQPVPVAAPMPAPIPVAAPIPMAPVAAAPMPIAPPVASAPPVAPAAPVAAVAPAAPVAPVAAAAPAAEVDLHALLLEVVSEKTGYPPEMLTLEMELEADLGIDSIKRVEILSAMNDLAPGLPEVDTAVMAKLATLGQVVDYMNEELAAAGGAPASNGAATAPAPAGELDLHALLLQVVSEKTGYPPEMLSMEMELEADLGIDSIKRVEILSAMNDLAPGLPEVDTAVMAKLATLGQVVDYMNEQLGHEPGEKQASPPAHGESHLAVEEPPQAPSALGLGRYVLEAVEQPALGMAQSGLYGEGRVAVTDDGSGIAAQVATRLQEHGIRAEVAPALADEDIRGVIFLGGLAEVKEEAAATQINRDAFEVARSVAARFEEDAIGHGIFVTVQDTGGRFGTGDFDPTRAWLAGCAGLARTVAQEWPNASVKAIDLERCDRSAVELADAIVGELLKGGPDLDVGLSADGVRCVLRSRQVDVVRGASPTLVDGDVLLASGGARGVTATTLIGLAGEAALRFVLLGRTALENEPACCAGVEDDAGLKRALLQEAVAKGEKLTPAVLGQQVSRILANREVQETLAAIERAGSEARYMAVDVVNLESVSSALQEVRNSWGPVAGIVHGAGVIADKRVAEKTQDQFDRVFDTKVEGLRTLLAATQEDPLKLLCFFSSVAARCGNIGQVDYAMANEVLNKVAWSEARRRGDGCLVKSLGWGPWEGGMVSPQLKAHFEAIGVPLIPLDVGARMLVDEVAGSAPAEVELVLGGEPNSEALAADPNDAGKSYRLEVAVNEATHPFFVDHAIQGTPVVPVAMAIEWFARSVQGFGPELVLDRLSDLKVLRGISLPDFGKETQHLVVRAKQLTNGSGATVALELGDVDGAIYYRCTATLISADQRPGRSGAAADPTGLESWGDRAVYDGELLFHGPAFQMIRGIEGVSDSAMVAELDGLQHQAALGPSSDWTTDPIAMDGGLQMALLWCKHVLGGASLPTGIQEVRLLERATRTSAEPIRCVLTGRSAKGSKSVSDLVFFDAEDEPLAELLGVETHLLPGQN